MALRRHLAWMGASQVAYFVVQFLASVCLSRLLNPDEMGVYAVALAVTGLLGLIQAAGLNAFIVREPDLTDELCESAFTINALIAFAVAAMIVAMSRVLGGFLHAPGVGSVLLVLASLQLLGIFEFLPSSRLEREARFQTIALIEGGRIIVSQGVSVSTALAGFSYMSIAYGQLAGAVFSTTGYCLVGRRFVRLRLRIVERRRLMHFGLQMLAVAGANVAGGKLSDILIGRLLGLGALGLYGRAASVNRLIQDNVYMVIVRVLFVDIAAEARRGASLRGRYLATIDILTALLWPAFAGLAVVAGPFINVAYGPRWAAAATPLRMLAIASMVHVIVSLSWQLFVVRDEINLQTRIEFRRTIFGLTLLGFGCMFGLAAAAAARIGEAIFTVIIYWPHIARMTDTRLGEFTGAYLRSLLLTAAAIAPAVLVMSGFGWAAATPLAPLLGAIAAGLAIWVAGLVYLDHPLAREIGRLGGRLVGAGSQAGLN